MVRGVLISFRTMIDVQIISRTGMWPLIFSVRYTWQPNLFLGRYVMSLLRFSKCLKCYSAHILGSMEKCMLRYSIRYILSVAMTRPLDSNFYAVSDSHGELSRNKWRHHQIFGSFNSLISQHVSQMTQITAQHAAIIYLKDVWHKIKLKTELTLILSQITRPCNTFSIINPFKHAVAVSSKPNPHLKKSSYIY